MGTSKDWRTYSDKALSTMKNDKPKTTEEVEIEPVPTEPISDLLGEEKPEETDPSPEPGDDSELVEKVVYKRGAGRPRKDEGLYNAEMIRPAFVTFSETISRIIGDKWQLTGKETDAWTAVAVPILNKYVSGGSQYAAEVNAVLLLSTYVGSRFISGIAK